MSGATFQVADLPVAEKALEGLEIPASVGSMIQYPVEAFEINQRKLVTCDDAHPLASAARTAFYQHYPLTISPDDVWFCIAQGFAQHVNLHAEALRGQFVRHEGKKKLLVIRPDFTLGKPNPWPEVFTAFSEQIGAHVGEELRRMLVADFSTTTYFHRAATEVAMMDAFQPYFEYEMMAGCGIPSITLTGTAEDWQEIRRRAAGLARYGLEEWMGALLPVLEELEAAARGKADRGFWNSFFRHMSSSVGEAMTGWIHVLFPYLKQFERWEYNGKLEPNPYMKTWQVDYRNAVASRGKGRWPDSEEINGPILEAIPAGIANAPVKVIDGRNGAEHKMRFVAGMFGVAQEEATGSLSAAYGWAIVYDKRLAKKDRWGSGVGEEAGN